MFKKILQAWQILNNDIAIDLGSSNTLIHVKGKEGIQLREPSIVALKVEDGKKSVIAVGEDAKKLVGRNPGLIEIYYPIQNGIIVDDAITELMLRNFMNKISNSDLLRPNPRIVLGVPANSTKVERRIFKEVLTDAGARDVLLVESNFASAIGANLDVESSKPSMIVNIGAGVTEIGVIALKTPIVSKTFNVGGDKLDRAIIDYIKFNMGIKIGPETAERIKKELSTPLEAEASEKDFIEVRGQAAQTGLPVKFYVNKKDVLLATSKVYEEIIMSIAQTIESLSPEVAADLYEAGMTLCGGVANIKGLAEIIESFTGIKVTVAKDPQLCVINGLEKVVELLNQKGS
jgi:rod shape-determining protein MreB